MTGPASAAVLRQALDYLLNCAWQAPLVALAALVSTKVAGLSSRGRCLAFAAALLLVGLAPLLRVHLPAPPGIATVSQAPASAVSPSATPVGRLVGELLVLGAGLVVAVAALRLAAGWLAARRLVRHSTPARLPAAATRAMASFLAPAGVAVPHVRTCEGVTGPAVVGAWSPVVLLPPGFEGLSEEPLVAALLHECAHVARRDYALNLLCEALALPSSWHPAARTLKRRYRAAREAACDQLAAAALGSPTRYARCLVDLARTVEGGGRPACGPALQLIGRGELEDRVRTLTRPTARPARLHPLQTAAAIALTLGCMAPLTCLHLTPVLKDREAARDVARVAVFGAPAPAASPPLSMGRVAPQATGRPRWARTASRRRSGPLHAAVTLRLAVASSPLGPITLARPADALAPPPDLVLTHLGQAADIGQLVFAVDIGAVSHCLAPATEADDHRTPHDAPTTVDDADFDPFPPAPALAPATRPRSGGCLKSAAIGHRPAHGLV